MRVKTGPDFKLSKETKRILASMPSDKRSMWKSMMIEAEVSAKKAKLAKLSFKSEKGDE
jgi:hypothetical protein